MAEKLVVDQKLFLGYNKFVFYIFGCGGTGSYLIRDLARIIGISNAQFKRQDAMVLIDKDVVEEKNLARQNFVRADVGKNKADVLAGRYGKSFGVDISFIPEYINENNWKEHIDAGRNDCVVIVGCVDNNKTRCVLHKAYRALPRAIYLDSGNEEYGGQVLFSSNTGWNDVGYSLGLSGSTRINDVVEEFNLQPDDRHPDELSCAERSLSAPQNIATNIMAAEILFNYCNAIIAGAVNYQNAPDRYEITGNSQYGRTERDRIKYLITRAPMIGNHVVFFNAKTNKTSTRPFSETVQDALLRNR